MTMNKATQNNKVVILGEHPILPNIRHQYAEMGTEVCHYNDINTTFDINDCDELFVLTHNKCQSSTEADNNAIALLSSFAHNYNPENHNGKKLLCHLLLQNNTSLHILQTTDFCDEIKLKIDVYPFTIDEVWSKSIDLDREPITLKSEKRVHLVIFGMSEMAEMVAINAAHKAHYPNFVRNHTLRTRITIVDENITAKYEAFISKYQHLFDNSYYRIINPNSSHVVEKFHAPMYEKSRECFVDVEWEFVNASTYNTTVLQKLAYWATDNSQLLTIAMTFDDESLNIDRALHLPDDVYSAQIPIYIYLRNATMLERTKRMEKFATIYPFGMLNRGYDIKLPLITMAKTINHIYDQFYNDNYSHFSDNDWQMQYAVEIDCDAMEKSWSKLSTVKRQSNICNAMTIASKMKSIGLGEDDWDKFYDISQQEIELLAQVEHNRWNVEELILGYRPCTDDEQQMIENDISLKEVLKRKNKIHYDIRAYRDLRADATGKSVTIYDICLCSCLPLIAKSFVSKYNSNQLHEKGGIK